MPSVIKSGPQQHAQIPRPKAKTVVGIVILASGLWLSYAVVRELLIVVADPTASAWLATFGNLPPEARTITTPQGEYRLPVVLLQAVGIALLALFLYCLTNLAAVILRIGGWMLRDDADEILKKINERIDASKKA